MRSAAIGRHRSCLDRGLDGRLGRHPQPRPVGSSVGKRLRRPRRALALQLATVATQLCGRERAAGVGQQRGLVGEPGCRSHQRQPPTLAAAATRVHGVRLQIELGGEARAATSGAIRTCGPLLIRTFRSAHHCRRRQWLQLAYPRKTIVSWPHADSAERQCRRTRASARPARTACRAGEPADERKLATVLFADLVGSTALADAEDPERTRGAARRVLRRHGRRDRARRRHRREVRGRRRHGGLRRSRRRTRITPSARLHAALAMQRRLRSVFGGALSLRIGVNTGRGRGRSRARGQLLRHGRRRQRGGAARAGGAPGEILVGARTVDGRARRLRARRPFTVEAKGKPERCACRRRSCARCR